jgi:hypothetical protein
LATSTGTTRTQPIIGGVAVGSGQHSHTHDRYGGCIKFWEKFFLEFGKTFLTFGGDKGGATSISVHTMIHISLNDSRNFGIGFEYRGKSLSNYSIKRFDFHLLLITVSFVFTRFNT